MELVVNGGKNKFFEFRDENGYLLSLRKNAIVSVAFTPTGKNSGFTTIELQGTNNPHMIDGNHYRTIVRKLEMWD